MANKDLPWTTTFIHSLPGVFLLGVYNQNTVDGNCDFHAVRKNPSRKR